jgi:hypothetical protein
MPLIQFRLQIVTDPLSAYIACLVESFHNAGFLFVLPIPDHQTVPYNSQARGVFFNVCERTDGPNDINEKGNVI